MSEIKGPSSIQVGRRLNSVSAISVVPPTNSFFRKILAICTLACSSLWKTVGTRPFIKVTSKSGTSDWLFDSGASVTCMSSKQFRLIPIDQRPEKLPNMTKLVDASGNDLHVFGVYNLQLTVHGKSIYTPVYVCQKLHSAAILGIDSISRLGIAYSGRKECFFFDDILDEKGADRFIIQTNHINAISSERFLNFATEISTTEKVKIPPLCHATVCLNSISNFGYSPPSGSYGITHIFSEHFPNVSSNSGLVQINQQGNVFAQLFNNDILPVEIPRSAVVGQLEIVNKDRLQIVDKKLFLTSIDKAVGNSKIKSPPPNCH